LLTARCRFAGGSIVVGAEGRIGRPAEEDVMKYALLIYGDESEYPEAGSEASAKMMQEYAEFTAAINEQGINLGGEALHDTGAATTVRVRNDETLTTDGPFAETKEALGGFYLIEAADLDEAIAVAAKLPGSWYGSVEIRPIYVWDADDAG
jgi:hypothetical protein